MAKRSPMTFMRPSGTGTAGPLLMLAAGFLFTVLNVLIKSLGSEFTPWHIGFYRFFGGMAFLVALFGRHRNPFRGHDIRLLVLRGCSGSIAFIAVVTAIRMLPLSTAVVIFYGFPAFAAVFSYLIYGDRMRPAELACIALVLVGIGILFDFRPQGGLAGQAVALAAAVFAGLTVTLIRSLREKNGPVVIYLYFCAMGTLATLPSFALAPVFPATTSAWVLVAGIVLVSVAAQLAMNQGFFYCRGWEGGVYMSSEVLFTALVGIGFLGDPVGWRFWTGGFLVIGSVLFLNRLKAGSRSGRPVKPDRALPVEAPPIDEAAGPMGGCG